MFNFMDNVKKVVSNVQDLAVNVMNELDEGGGELSPDSEHDPMRDGPLQRLKKDASAASEMINSAVNMFGEDEMFITLLAKFIKQNTEFITEDSRNALLKEWLNVYDTEYSNAHSAESLTKLSDLAVTINDFFYQHPSLEGVGKQFASLRTANARMSTEIDRLRQQLSFLSSNSTDPVTAFANDRTSVGPPVARVSPMNTMEVKANDEKNLAVIKNQSEQLDRQQKHIVELEEQILNLEEIIQQKNIQIKQLQQDASEAGNNENLFEELAKKDLIIQKFEEGLLQERNNAESAHELQLRFDELSRHHTDKIREYEGRLDDEKRQLTLYTEELNEKHEKLFTFGNDMYKLQGEIKKMEVQKEGEIKQYEKKLAEEREKVKNLTKDLKQSSSTVNQLKKHITELESQICKLQEDESFASNATENDKIKHAELEASISELQIDNDALQQSAETKIEELKNKLENHKELQVRVRQLEEENHRLQQNENVENDSEALKQELAKKESALEELEKDLIDTADQVVELKKRIVDLQSENADLQKATHLNEEVTELNDNLSNYNSREKHIEELKIENARLQELTNNELDILKVKLAQKETHVEDLENKLMQDKNQITQLEEAISRLQNENSQLTASLDKGDLTTLTKQLFELEQRASDFEHEKTRLQTSADEEIKTLKGGLQQKEAEFNGLQEKMMEVYNQISELEARANSLDNEKSNLHQSASNEINALKAEVFELSELKTKIHELENEKARFQEAAQIEIDNLKEELKGSNEIESRLKELEGERVRLQELVETEEQRSHEIRIELDNTTQKLSALESKCTDQQDLLKQSAIECEKIAAQCKTLERENENLKTELDNLSSEDSSVHATNSLDEKYKQLESDFEKAVLTRDEALMLYENHKVQLIQSKQSFASLEEELRSVNNVTQQELKRMQTTLFTEQEQLKERLLKETAELMLANQKIAEKESEVNELQQEMENMQSAYRQLTDKLLNQENNSGFVKESESEHLQALQGQLQLVSDECESFKKQIYDLQTQITEKTAEVEHYKKQASMVNTRELEELTVKYDAATNEANSLRNELKKFEENQKKLKSHVQKLTDNLQAKDEEVLQIAREMENQAVSLKADFNPDEIKSLKKMLQSATHETRKYTEKAEQLKLIITQNNIQLKEKDEMILKLQALHETLRIENENIISINKQLHEELEKAGTQVVGNSTIALKKLQDQLASLSQQYDIIKQAFFKMIIDEEHAHDHCLLLINLLDYDPKSRDVLRDYVNAKYQGKLEHFWQKFNFKSSAQLAQQLLDFVDQDIAKGKIALAPIAESAFQMNIDEPLPNPSADDNDLRSIL